VAYHSIPWIELEREMFEVLKTEKFATLFSFIIGFGLIAILIPVCKGEQCFVKKAPSVEEIKKCYQFTSETVECPAKGAIEAFVAYSHA
jgi:hypothetical protein